MSYKMRGAAKEDLVGGLAYSIAYNYLNRLVRERKIGDCIFFQGGTAYNDSVAAAFSMILGKEIIVPPHNGVIGAIGMALLARERMQRTHELTKFRGWDLEAVDYTVKDFVCKGCTNECDVRQFTIEGEKTYWGDKCSDRYRKRVKVDKEPVIADLIALREEVMLEYYQRAAERSEAAQKTVGLSRAMYTFDRLPFWATFFAELGFKPLLSPETDRVIERTWGRRHRRRALLPDPRRPRPRRSARRGRRRPHLPAQPGQRGDRVPRGQLARLPVGSDAALRRARRASRRAVPRPHPQPAGALPRRHRRAREGLRADGQGAGRPEPGRAAGVRARRRRAGRVPAPAARRRHRGAGRPQGERRPGHRAHRTPVQHVRQGHQHGHPAQAAQVLRRQRDPARLPAAERHRHPRRGAQHVLELRAQDPRRRPASSPVTTSCTSST